MTQGIVDTQVAIFYERPTCASSPAALSQARGRRLRQWATDWNRRVFGPFEAYSRMTHTTTKKMWVMTRAEAHGYLHRVATRPDGSGPIWVVFWRCQESFFSQASMRFTTNGHSAADPRRILLRLFIWLRLRIALCVGSFNCPFQS